jgi:hypothetical protein
MPHKLSAMPKFIPVEQTPTQIRATAEEVAFAAETLRALAERTELMKIDALHVGSFDQLTKALVFLNSYCSAVGKALHQHRADRGDLHAVEKSVRSKPKKSDK